jgi:hypothetical protein
MTEKRAEYRLPESTVPQRLKRIMVSVGPSLLGCQVMDASLHGLGFVVDKEYSGEVSLGQDIHLTIDAVDVDARIVNLHPRYGDEAFRFGVRLFNERQLAPYHQQLALPN